MEKEWYIILQGATLGPFSFEDLRKKPEINPDTLVWKEGFPEWTPLRKVPELQELFVDPKELSSEEEGEEKVNGVLFTPNDELILESKIPPYIYLLFLFLIFLFILYAFFRF